MRPIRLGVKPSKYRARPCVVAGQRFDSQREGARYLLLLEWLEKGRIRNLELQPRFDLVVPTPAGEIVKIGRYTADFKYEVAANACADWNGQGWTLRPYTPEEQVAAYQRRQELAKQWPKEWFREDDMPPLTIIEDVKSPATRTTSYRLRKKMVEATYGITITEV